MSKQLVRVGIQTNQGSLSENCCSLCKGYCFSRFTSWYKNNNLQID